MLNELSAALSLDPADQVREAPSAPFDEDLACMLREFREGIGACGVAVTLHPSDGCLPRVEFLEGGDEALDQALQSWEWTAATAGWTHASASFGWHMFSLNVASDECGLVAVNAFYRGLAPGAAAAREVIALRFRPVLAAYFRLRLLHRSARRQLETMASALAHLDFGVVGLDRQARILFENAAAARILDQGKGLQRCRGSVGATCLADDARLRAAIKQALSGGSVGDLSAASSTLLLGKAGRKAAPLVAVVAPADHSGFAQDPAAILHIFDAAAPLERTIRPVCEWYGLSPAETRVVRMLVAGRSVADVASEEEIKQDTVRTYLKSIFRKTNSRSQTDLVRLMMSNPVRLRGRALARERQPQFCQQ